MITVNIHLVEKIVLDLSHTESLNSIMKPSLNLRNRLREFIAHLLTAACEQACTSLAWDLVINTHKLQDHYLELLVLVNSSILLWTIFPLRSREESIHQGQGDTTIQALARRNSVQLLDQWLRALSHLRLLVKANILIKIWLTT